MTNEQRERIERAIDSVDGIGVSGPCKWDQYASFSVRVINLRKYYGSDWRPHVMSMHLLWTDGKEKFMATASKSSGGDFWDGVQEAINKYEKWLGDRALGIIADL